MVRRHIKKSEGEKRLESTEIGTGVGVIAGSPVMILCLCGCRSMVTVVCSRLEPTRIYGEGEELLAGYMPSKRHVMSDLLLRSPYCSFTSLQTFSLILSGNSLTSCQPTLCQFCRPFSAKGVPIFSFYFRAAQLSVFLRFCIVLCRPKLK